MNGLEILAPAGGMECIYPAVRAGADAVYIGASGFSARSSAHNFDKEEMKQAVRYCHENGTAVHLACNTIIHDDEMDAAMQLIAYACEIGVDALIMQDLGLIDLVRRSAPSMPIHGSTQLSVHTRKGVEYLHRMGLTRAVLSRELSRDEIREIAKDCPIELEVFVHGALCMSVSGQCYFSAMLGSRSGNRGSCAQPCRLPFSVKGGTGHDLSLKDLSVIGHLRELQEMGIASAKIEGRMKRPEYVAAAVRACREGLDNGSVSEETDTILRSVFSRSGFTDGYYEGRTGVDMFGIRSKENVEAADSKVFARVHEWYKNERQHIPVDFALQLREGEHIRLSARDADGNTAAAEGDVPQKALKTPIDRLRCEKSLAKTGGTPFVMRRLDCEIDEGLMVPASALNGLRVQCLTEIAQKRSELRPVPFHAAAKQTVGNGTGKQPDRYRVRLTDDQIPDVFLDSELLYVPLTLSDQKLRRLQERGFRLALDVPRGLFCIEQIVFERLQQIQKRCGIEAVLANNVAVLEMARELRMDVHGGFGLNIANTEALYHLQKMGVLDCEVSFELTLEQIAALGRIMPIGILSAGRLPLMLTRNCPAQNDGRGCKHCKSAPLLRDRKGVDFPMQCYGACTEILNSVPLHMADRRREMKGIDFEVLRFSVENMVEKGEKYQVFRQNSTPKDSYTRGLYYRGVE